jgi:hypothetical protein
MRVIASCLLVLIVLLRAMTAAGQPEPPPDSSPQPAPAAQPKKNAPYETHMRNGIKLFKEEKYDGAVAEFWAAYREKKVGAPLINLALAYKRMKSSAKAIEVLELALEKHRDSLPESQIAAAKTEIEEMRKLLAWVEVTIEPPGAGTKLYIDGRVQEDGAWDEPIPLEPGTRTFVAKRPGFDDASVERQLTAGTGNAPVVLELVQTDGRVRVQANEPDAEIQIDGQVEGAGTYDGMLPRGVHTIVVDDGDEHEIRIRVRPGGDHTVTQKDDGTLESAAEIEEGEEKDPFGPPKILEPLRGVYGYGGGSLLTVLSNAGQDRFEATDSIDRWGAAASLHLGYRVAEWAAFEFWGQYSDIRVAGTVTLDEQPDGSPNRFPKSQMVLKSGRFGLLFRGWQPGRSWIRFVGTLGSGILVEKLSWRFSEDGTSFVTPPNRGIFLDSEVVVGVFGSLDLGVEIEWSNVLFSLMFQHTLQSTKHFDIEDTNVFGESPLLIHGPSFRVGYGLW